MQACPTVDFAADTDVQKPEAHLPLPLTPYVDDLHVPPVAHPHHSAEPNLSQLRLFMVPAKAQLHRDLPATTDIWTYRPTDQHTNVPQLPLGPTIEVRQGQRLRVEWVNALRRADGTWAKHPVVAVRELPSLVRDVASREVHCPENLLGRTLGKHDHTAVDLPPWTVVHLHGGRTTADSDGWPETARYPGQVQTDIYDNTQPGTLLWYHDHAMAMTRLNVYAGLAGFYVIRDPREAELRLPHGEDDHELLLLIQDRTVTCPGDHPGIPAGQLLHKTGTAGGKDLSFGNPPQSVQQAPMEFFGPLTLVNGKVWPRREVRADVYRLRLLNGSNARAYRLAFTDEGGKPVTVPTQMIGSDGGLLDRPLDLNDGAKHPLPGTITLAPAERVDVLVDFRGFAGKRLELRNQAKAPFNGKDADPCDPLADFLPFPQIMRFDVGHASNHHHLLPADTALMPSAVPWDYAAVQAVAKVERLVALVEDNQGVLQLNECTPLLDEHSQPVYWDGTSNLPVTQLALRQRGETRHRIYCLLRGMFSDAARYLARDGDVEIWKIINISPDTHPVHIHLVQFKLLARESYSEYERKPKEDPDTDTPPGGYVTECIDATPVLPRDLADAGWKDTIRANPAEMTVIAVPFRHYAPQESAPAGGKPLGYTGRYMYHCHVLEHEDHEMMRPYAVMPSAVIEHMRAMGGEMSGMMGMPGADDDGWYMAPELCCCKEPMPDMPH